MVGRKAPKSSKGKVVAARDLLKKTRNKLRKKNAPQNQVDLQTLTKTKKLVIDQSTKTFHLLERELRQANPSDGKTDFAFLQWAALFAKLRDGLAAKRMEALVGIGEYLETNVKVLFAYGPQVFMELTPRIVDDDENVRAYAIDIIRGSIFENLVKYESPDALKKFCFTIKKHLHLQLKIALSNLHGTKRLSGLRFLFYCLQEVPSRVYQDDTYINQILPLLIRQLPLALRPGKVEQSSPDAKATRLVQRKLTPFDNILQPYLSRWSPLILCCIFGSLIHIATPCESSFGDSQYSLSDALEMALNQSCLREQHYEAVAASSPISHDGMMSVDRREQFPVLRLVELGVGLLRVIHSHQSPKQGNTLTSGSQAVLQLGILMLDWVIALTHLSKRNRLLCLETPTPALLGTPGATNLTHSLLSSGQELMELNEILLFGRRSFIGSIRSTIEFLADVDGSRDVVVRDIRQLLINLDLCAKLCLEEADKTRTKIAELLTQLAQIDCLQNSTDQPRPASPLQIHYGKNFDDTLSDKGSSSGVEENSATFNISANSTIEGFDLSLIKNVPRLNLIDHTLRILKGIFPQWKLRLSASGE